MPQSNTLVMYPVVAMFYVTAIAQLDLARCFIVFWRVLTGYYHFNKVNEMC